jgi:hypothetical protein
MPKKVRRAAANKMKNQIEYLESVVAQAEKSLEWMSRPDQDDDYVVCGLGWKAMQERRTEAKHWIECLKKQGYYFDYNQKTGYSAFCKGNKQIPVRTGKWGIFAIIDGKCCSEKKMKTMGYQLCEEILKIDINGNENWEMI